MAVKLSDLLERHRPFAAIYLVCMVHLLWGLCLLFMPAVPAPFGAFLPYLTYLNEKELGFVFTVTALLPPFVIVCRSGTCHWLLLAPQQIVLFYGILWSLGQVLFISLDPRILLVLAYTVPMTLVHFVTVVTLRRGRATI